MQIVIVFIMNKAYQDTVPLAWRQHLWHGLLCKGQEPETFQEKSTGWMLTQVLQSGSKLSGSQGSMDATHGVRWPSVLVPTGAREAKAIQHNILGVVVLLSSVTRFE